MNEMIITLILSNEFNGLSREEKMELIFFKDSKHNNIFHYAAACNKMEQILTVSISVLQPINRVSSLHDMLYYSPNLDMVTPLHIASAYPCDTSFNLLLNILYESYDKELAIKTLQQVDKFQFNCIDCTILNSPGNLKFFLDHQFFSKFSRQEVYNLLFDKQNKKYSSYEISILYAPESLKIFLNANSLYNFYPHMLSVLRHDKVNHCDLDIECIAQIYSKETTDIILKSKVVQSSINKKCKELFMTMPVLKNLYNFKHYLSYSKFKLLDDKNLVDFLFLEQYYGNKTLLESVVIASKLNMNLLSVLLTHKITKKIGQKTIIDVFFEKKFCDIDCNFPQYLMSSESHYKHYKLLCTFLKSELFGKIHFKTAQHLLFERKYNQNDSTEQLQEYTILEKSIICSNAMILSCIMQLNIFKILDIDYRSKLLFFLPNTNGNTILQQSIIMERESSFKLLIRSKEFKNLPLETKIKLLFFDTNAKGNSIFHQIATNPKGLHSIFTFLMKNPVSSKLSATQIKMLLFEKQIQNVPAIKAIKNYTEEIFKLLIKFYSSKKCQKFFAKNLAKYQIPDIELDYLESVIQGIVVSDAEDQERAEEGGDKLVRGSDSIVSYSLKHPLIHDSLVPYYQKQAELLLYLRLLDLNIEQHISILSGNYKWNGDDKMIQRIFDSIQLDDKKLSVLPLNIMGNHLVGVVFSKDGSAVTIEYMDPENRGMPFELKNSIQKRFKEGGYDVEFSELILEKQKYDNCAAEVIENFVYYLTGKRAEQDYAVLLHSELLERYLLTKGENALIDKANSSGEVYSRFVFTNKVIEGLLGESKVFFSKHFNNKFKDTFFAKNDLMKKHDFLYNPNNDKYITLSELLNVENNIFIYKKSQIRIVKSEIKILTDDIALDEKIIAQLKYYYETGIASKSAKSFLAKHKVSAYTCYDVEYTAMQKKFIFSINGIIDEKIIAQLSYFTRFGDIFQSLDELMQRNAISVTESSISNVLTINSNTISLNNILQMQFHNNWPNNIGQCIDMTGDIDNPEDLNQIAFDAQVSSIEKMAFSLLS